MSSLYTEFGRDITTDLSGEQPQAAMLVTNLSVRPLDTQDAEGAAASTAMEQVDSPDAMEANKENIPPVLRYAFSAFTLACTDS